MEKRNRYRNPVRLTSVFRVIFLCLLVGTIGAAFVYLQNRQVKQGDAIRVVEMEIEELDHQLQLWELRIAGAKDRIELARRLRWIGSELEPIDPTRVLKIKVEPEADLEQEMVIVE